jgi:transcriptional regulator NrdR family protein
MTTVIKKGGRRQAFIPAKIKKAVERAAKDARLSSAQIKVLVREVAEPVIAFYGKKKTVKAVDIRRALLGRLNRRAKSVVLSWRRYQNKHK